MSELAELIREKRGAGLGDPSMRLCLSAVARPRASFIDMPSKCRCFLPVVEVGRGMRDPLESGEKEETSGRELVLGCLKWAMVK